MAPITITRMELLAKKEQVALARQGLDLLRQKRAALLRELMRTADHVLVRREELQGTAVTARRALAKAEATAGPALVRSAAMASQSDLPIAVQTAKVMGVKVPVIEQKRVGRSVLGRGYALAGTSVTIDETAVAFEAQVDSLIALAESELRLRRLAGAIQQTSRRANALEHVVLPRLETELKMIRMALDERERAEHYRLKRIKQLRLQKKEVA